MCFCLNNKVKSIDCHTDVAKISEIASRVKEILEVEIKDQHFALTCDHWTSFAETSYLAVTIHYMDDDWNLVSFTLICKEHNGSSRAAEVLRGLREAWVAYNPVGVETDTAPVMGAFGKLPDDVPHLFCVEITTVSQSKSLFKPFDQFF